MRWIAFAYGLALGVGQFAVLRAIIRAALAAGRVGGPVRLPRTSLWQMVVYIAAALGAVYLFTQHLVSVAVGLGIGLAGTAGIAAALAVRRMVRQD